MQSSQEPGREHARRIGPWQVRIIIFVVAIAFLLLALDWVEIEERPLFYRDVIKDVGVVILGLVVVDFVWQLVGGDPVQNAMRTIADTIDARFEATLRLPGLMGRVQRLGLEDLVERQDSLHINIPARIDAASHAVDFSGWTLNMMRENAAVREALARAARRGVRVRILLPEVAGATWLKQTNQAELIEGMEAGCRQIVRDLRPLAAEGAKIRLLKKYVIMGSVLRFDDWMQVTPYLVCRSTPQTPRLHLRGPDLPLFQAWLAEFEFGFAHAIDAYTGY